MSEQNLFQQQAESVIQSFVEAAKTAFGQDLVSAVLFGSAAEGKLRATSDVNMMLVLKRFEQAAADSLREPLRLAHASVEMHVMFVLENELAAAADAFTIKFADMLARHRLLYGADPFIHLQLSREALIRRLKQILLNFQLRMRERYVLISLREEQLVQIIADAAAPLRAAAASLLQLEGRQYESPKQALESIAHASGDQVVCDAIHQISTAREEERLAPGVAGPTLTRLLSLAGYMRDRAEQLG